MTQAAAQIWLVRHGETEWSKSGQHTGVTDLPLTPAGEEAARALRPALAEVTFDVILSSPLQRARRTAELAGIVGVEEVPDLVEWDYGEYEGRTTADIRTEQQGWSVWTDGAPGGETPEQLCRRVDRVVERLRGVEGMALLVAHGHVLRALAARWIDAPVSLGMHLPLDTARVSVLSYDRAVPTLHRWNAEA